MAQEAQTGALYQPRGMRWGGRWEGGSKGRGYTYGWFTLRFDRTQQNSVKQLSFNWKIKIFFKVCMCVCVYMWARKMKCIHEMRCSRSGPQSSWASRPPEAYRNMPFVNYLWFSSCESVNGASASYLQLKVFSLGEKKNLTTLSPKTARKGCQKEKLKEKNPSKSVTV